MHSCLHLRLRHKRWKNRYLKRSAEKGYRSAPEVTFELSAFSQDDFLEEERQAGFNYEMRKSFAVQEEGFQRGRRYFFSTARLL